MNYQLIQKLDGTWTLTIYIDNKTTGQLRHWSKPGLQYIEALHIVQTLQITLRRRDRVLISGTYNHVA